jgi:glycolate oxidase iron-sulfur subunit
MSAPFLDEKQALACIHCGLCLSSCPTYLETGNENDSPRGRIYLMRAVQEGRLPLEGAAVRHFDLCLGCRACEAACPSGVAYGDLLEHTRDHVEKNFARPPAQRWLRRVLIEKIFPHPARLRWLLAPARATKAIGLAKILPRFAREALSLVPAGARSEKVPELSPATAARRGRVGFMEGCVMGVMFGQTNLNTVRLLNAAGYDVLTPRAQGCCGALHAHNGNLASARACARANMTAFAGQECEAIITNAAGCGSSLKEYGHWLPSKEAELFGAKIKDLTEFLSVVGTPRCGVRSAQRADPAFSDALRVTYHDACHLAHAQRITKAPRDLLRAVAGENLIDMPEADVCCGSAGTYNLTEPEMAERLQRRKIENILRTGADIVVTTNPGCILQIRAGLAKAGSRVRVMHMADYLCAVIQPPPITTSPS